MTNTNNFHVTKVFTFRKEYSRTDKYGETYKAMDFVKLYFGGCEGKFCYRILSKTIPITGEFTGFPNDIMINWFQSMGYTYIGVNIIPNINNYNKYKG